MQIKDSVALITGANRGVGRAFVEALLERGASRVYAAARDLASLEAVVRLDPKHIRALKLDVTSAEDARAAAAVATDLTLPINNATVLALGEPHRRGLDLPDVATNRPLETAGDRERPERRAAATVVALPDAGTIRDRQPEGARDEPAKPERGNQVISGSRRRRRYAG